jgi:hypothetical protein
MYADQNDLLTHFQHRLREEAALRGKKASESSLTVADIYYELLPFETCRKELGVESILDYEHALLRLLADEGGCVEIESLADRQRLQREANGWSPDPGVLRDFFSVGVRISSPIVEGREAEEATGAEEAVQMHETPEKEKNVDMDETLETAGTHEIGGTLEMPRKGPESPHYVNCPSCTETLPQQARVNFCPFCGEDVRRNICVSCDEKLKLNWRFCIACGREVEVKGSTIGSH